VSGAQIRLEHAGWASCYHSELGPRAVPACPLSDSWDERATLVRYELESDEGSCVRKTHV